MASPSNNKVVTAVRDPLPDYELQEDTGSSSASSSSSSATSIIATNATTTITPIKTSSNGLKSHIECSTSSDEGIYQEVDYIENNIGQNKNDDSHDGDEEDNDEDEDKKKAACCEANENEEYSVIIEDDEEDAGDADQFFLSPPPPPPPPPPPSSSSTSSSSNAWSYDYSYHQNLHSSNSHPRSNRTQSKTIGSMMAAFIPPKFTSPPETDTNIKPSEYLKRVSGNTSSRYNGYLNDRSNNVKNKIVRCSSESHLNSELYEVIKEDDYESCERSQSECGDNTREGDDTQKNLVGDQTNVQQKQPQKQQQLQRRQQPLKHPRLHQTLATFVITQEELKRIHLKKTNSYSGYSGESVDDSNGESNQQIHPVIPGKYEYFGVNISWIKRFQ